MSPSLPNLPHDPGVYLMRDVAGQIIYIGKARDLKKRVSSYFNKRAGRDLKTEALVQNIRHVDYVPTASERDALVLERKLINQYKPDFNIMWRDDKSYPYVVLTERDDFPRIFLTRRRKRGDGNRYFGPYPSVGRVRQLLRWAWRQKLFPLRPCDLEIKEGQPLPYEKVRSCLYLHTKECPAPCLGGVSRQAYAETVQKARWFFEGNKQRMIDAWEKEMARLSKRLEFERAAEVRDHIETVGHMQESVSVRRVSESDLNARVARSRSVQDLMGALNLKRPPERIECFDISHFQGDEKVASMVSFKNGRADKSNYRKFIIRSVEGIDDFKAMAEVVGRRVRRLRNEERPLPDLILVDGGKGQLSAAVGALRRENITVPLAALAKREEEVFLPGSDAALRLPMDSPALLLLRQIRDEAHRFAITFHRQRRAKKAWLPAEKEAS